jgi:hypothetical protein
MSERPQGLQAEEKVLQARLDKALKLDHGISHNPLSQPEF